MGITRQQALDCFASDDFIGIGMEADAVRRKLHPDGVVTYISEQTFDASASNIDTLYAHVHRSIELGATDLFFTDIGLPTLSLDNYEYLLHRIKQRFPTVRTHGLSPTHILTLASAAHVTLNDTLARLRDAGLDAIASSAMVLENLRILSHKCTTAEWVSVHRTAHKLGLTSSATMVFGAGESIDKRIDHLELLRQLQRETNSFTSFTPIPHQTIAGILTKDTFESTAIEYLKTVAVSRLYFDNVLNLQGSWSAQGLKILQMALRFGANDAGSVALEEHFAKSEAASEEEFRRIIREAGFKPAQRDSLYRTMLLN